MLIAPSSNNVLPRPYEDFQPDLLITVNFTTLGLSIDSISDIPKNSVQIMVAMTNNTEDVVLMTKPTNLLPGVNLIGMTSLEIHQTFKNPALSLFGLFKVSVGLLESI
jgi:hypothetical protein